VLPPELNLIATSLFFLLVDVTLKHHVMLLYPVSNMMITGKVF
jgi:hypothetical protein